MNEKTIKAIEEQLRLRNERLTLRTKEFGLSAKKWRRWGIAFAVGLLLVICGMTVFFGGVGLWKLSGKILSMENRNIKENEKTDTPQITPPTVPVNILAVVSSLTKCDAGTVKAESKTTPDTCPLVVAVIMYGLFVLAGLGVATFTVNHIAKFNNEVEG